MKKSIKNLPNFPAIIGGVEEGRGYEEMILPILIKFGMKTLIILILPRPTPVPRHL